MTAKPTRRRYTAEYKLRILRETDACAGKIGALLRREGLNSSNLTVYVSSRKGGNCKDYCKRSKGHCPGRRTRWPLKWPFSNVRVPGLGSEPSGQTLLSKDVRIKRVMP